MLRNRERRRGVLLVRYNSIDDSNNDETWDTKLWDEDAVVKDHRDPS